MTMSTNNNKSVEHTVSDSSPTGIARCDLHEGQSGPWIVHGVAIGANEVTHGANGPKFWPEEELRASVQSLVDVPFTKNHDDDNVESVVGQITDAGFQPGVGIVYEAEVDDEDLATKIARGRLEVSVHAMHGDGGRTGEGEMIVENVTFLDLSLVPRGGSPSNFVQSGESPSEVLASLDAEDVEAIIGGTDSIDNDESMTDDTDESKQDAQADPDSTEAQLMESGDLVMWGGEDSTAYGAIEESKMEGCFNSKIDGDTEVCAKPEEDEPVHLIEIHQPNSEEVWEPTGTMVAHLESTLNEWSPDAEVLDEPMEDEESESTAEGETEAESSESELTAGAEVTQLRDELESLRAENHELRNELQTVRLEYAEKLATDTAFEASELADRFSFDELRDRFEEAEASQVTDEGREAETSTPAPMTSGSESELSIGDKDVSEEIATIESKIEKYDEMGWTAAKAEAENRLDELQA